MLRKLDVNTILYNAKTKQSFHSHWVNHRPPAIFNYSLLSCISYKIPLLRQRYVAYCLVFSQVKQDWRWLNWERVVWIDKSCFVTETSWRSTSNAGGKRSICPRTPGYFAVVAGQAAELGQELLGRSQGWLSLTAKIILDKDSPTW
jgi:hypothetical protein